ncbi:hypothetical protein [Nocardioides sp. Soil805]|uniref:hypothetical protein n=1 Tax=Nocardioides sp. Soil805 TaxID=1736416 RepID=UPI0007029373|nr:hypothetical protein [Nocardioides sp. Soil805]KRF37385.1 hypothetical protein ASG94_08670 [Nocardioides sp. Soil805]
MTDSRFTTVCDDLEELLEVVDIDDVDDLDTLIMVLLGRPVVVAESWDHDQEIDALDVRVLGGELTAGVLAPFPLSVVELARSSAELARDIGPYAPPRVPPLQGNDVLSLSDDELSEDLQRALGQVRLFNLLDDD